MTLLKRVDRPAGIDRWYLATVTQDLFGDSAVLCAWGSRRNRYQRSRLTYLPDAEAGQQVEVIVERKIKRGYTLIDE
jgi:hypothetical protein